MGKPLFESALIVFSVLLALFVNRYAENQRTQEQKQVALERIAEEMKSNRIIIENALRIHKRTINNLQTALIDENNALRMYLKDRKYLDSDGFELLMNGESFYARFPSNTAWDAAKVTGIVTEFDYEIVEALTDVYDIQTYFVEKSIPTVTQTFFSPMPDQKEDVINALLLQTSNLTNQEETVLILIDEALKVIQGEKEEP